MGSPLIWFGDAAKFLKGILRFPDDIGQIYSEDPNNSDNKAYYLIEPGYTGIFAEDLNNPDNDTFHEIYNTGDSYQKYAKFEEEKNYNNETALISGFSRHRFTGIPAGNISVDYNLVGTSFSFSNGSGVTVTLEGEDVETFNGSATLSVPNGVTIQLVMSSPGAYTVYYSQPPASSIARTQLTSDAQSGLVKAQFTMIATTANGTYSRTGTLVTVTLTSHGMSSGQGVYLDFTTGTATDAYYLVTVVDANTFTVVDAASGATSGNVTRILWVPSFYNIASIIRNATGDFTATFTNAMSNIYYTPVGGCSPNVGVAFAANIGMNYNNGGSSIQAPTTTTHRFTISGISGGAYNPAWVYMTYFGV